MYGIMTTRSQGRQQQPTALQMAQRGREQAWRSGTQDRVTGVERYVSFHADHRHDALHYWWEHLDGIMEVLH